MKNDRLTYWCINATRQIRYGPDRERVYGELRLHVEDRKESFLAQGLSEEEAIDKTMEAMGKAEDVAPLLGQIHSPFWGYLLRACRIMLVILLCISIFSIWRYIKNNHFNDRYNFDFYLYDSNSYGGDTGRTLLHLSHPNVSFTSDGNTFTVTDVALWAKDGYDVPLLYICIQQTSPLPQVEHMEYYRYFAISSQFSAQDSLGNEYSNWFETRDDGGCRINAHAAKRSIFSCVHECWINDFPRDAQWVEICYERDGRNFSLRIDLTGGDCT